MPIIKKNYPSVSHVPNVLKYVRLFLISQKYKTFEVPLYEISSKPASHEMIIDYSGIQQGCKVFKLKNVWQQTNSQYNYYLSNSTTNYRHWHL